MAERVRVASLAEIPPGSRKLVELAYDTVAIFNVGGALYCIVDVCTHDGGPVAEGELEGCEITCPRHGARFDLRSGAALSMPATEPVPTFPVFVDGDDIFLELEEDDW